MMASSRNNARPHEEPQFAHLFINLVYEKVFLDLIQCFLRTNVSGRGPSAASTRKKCGACHI